MYIVTQHFSQDRYHADSVYGPFEIYQEAQNYARKREKDWQPGVTWFVRKIREPTPKLKQMEPDLPVNELEDIII